MARGACQDTAYLQPLGKRAHAVGKVASPSFDVALRSIVLWTAHQTKIGAAGDKSNLPGSHRRRAPLAAASRFSASPRPPTAPSVVARG